MKYITPFLALISTGLLLMSVTGCGGESIAETQTTQEANRASIDRVTAGPPVRKTLELHTVQPGRIEAFEQTPLYPKVTGYVKEIAVDIGDRVEKDAVLVRLWVPEMKDELDRKQALRAQAEAEIQQSEAAVRAAEAALATAEAQVTQAKAGIGRAEAAYQRWQSEHSRMSDLAGRGSVTRKLEDETLNQFRAADADRKEAAAQVASAEAAVNEARANIAKAEADAAAAAARLRVSDADLAYAKTMLAYAEIKAPYPGIVTRRHVDTGHYVQSTSGVSTQPLLVVARSDRLRVFVDVPETEAALVDPGDTATIFVQAMDELEIKTIKTEQEETPITVTRTSWALGDSNRALRTEIELPNVESRLRPGMYATVQILLERRENVLTLPVTAIVREGRDTFCCVVADGRIARTQIALGLRSGEEVEVLSGLTGKETVVLARAETLQDGQPVEVIQPETK